VDVPLFRAVLREELAGIRARIGQAAWSAGRHEEAAALFDELVTAPVLPDFLTLPAYDRLESP
jgi:malate synthase